MDTATATAPEPQCGHLSRTGVGGKGFTLVYGGALTPGQWNNAKNAGAIAPPPPSPKAYFSSYGQGPITRDKWTQGMGELETFAIHFAKVVLGKPVSVNFYSESGGQNWRACYGSNSLKFAKRECGGNKPGTLGEPAASQQPRREPKRLSRGLFLLWHRK
jgi:hypothetical protein